MLLSENFRRKLNVREMSITQAESFFSFSSLRSGLKQSQDGREAGFEIFEENIAAAPF